MGVSAAAMAIIRLPRPGTFRHRLQWTALFMVNTFVFSTAAWLAQDLSFVIDQGWFSWPVATLLVRGGTHGSVDWVGVLVLAVLIAVGVGRAARLPGRSIPVDTPRVGEAAHGGLRTRQRSGLRRSTRQSEGSAWEILIGPLAAVTVVVATRCVSAVAGVGFESGPSPLSKNQILDIVHTDWWISAAAGTAVAVVGLTLRGAAGLGRALIGGPAATAGTAAGLDLVHIAGWIPPVFHHPDLTLLSYYVSNALSTLVVGLLLVGVAAVVPVRWPISRTGRGQGLMAYAVGAAAVSGGACLILASLTSHLI